MPIVTHTVVVDDLLLWVIRPPSLPAGAARPSSPEQLALLRRRFDDWRDEHDQAERRERLIGTVAFTVLESLREPPELPYIGEPFGGQDGTD